MNRTGLFVLIAALVIAAAAYWYFSAGKAPITASAPASDTTASTAPQTTPPPSTEGQGAPPPRDYATAPTGGARPAEPPADGATPPPPGSADTTAPSDQTGDADRQVQEERKEKAARDAEQARSGEAEGYSQRYTTEAAPPPPPPPPPPTTAPPAMQAAPAAPVAAPPAPTRTTAAIAPAMPEDIPIFPWPVPKASATQEVPRKLIMGNTNAPTFGTVAERIAAALDRAGYGERSYYALADGHGIAIATQLEQINDDGTPALGEARFEEKLAPLSTEQFSLTSYVKALFTARSGRFRIIVFTLSHGVTQDTKPPAEALAKTWATSGQTHLPVRYASIPFGPSVTCTALIYEFEKKDYNTAAAFVQPGKLNAMAHLIKAGIWSLLGK